MDDIDVLMQGTENLNNVWGVELLNGRINPKGAQFCNVCRLSNLFVADKHMIQCECCKGWGHVFKCWNENEDGNILDLDEHMKQLKKTNEIAMNIKMMTFIALT